MKDLEVATANDYMLMQASMDGVTTVANAIKRIGTELIQEAVELCNDMVQLQ